MPEPDYATVTISGAGDYRNGTYRSPEIDIDISDPDNPFLRIWLDAADEQPDGNYRIEALPDRTQVPQSAPAGDSGRD